MKIGEKIRRARKDKGMAQQDLANQINIHIGHISRLENGHYQPSIEVVKKLTEALEITADYLLDDSIDDFEININDKNLAEKIRLIDSLDEKDRQTVSHMIDTMLTKKKMTDLLTPKAT